MSLKSRLPVLLTAAVAALALFGGCVDMVPPLVSVTSPADSVVVSGVVSFEATAYDSGGVVNVQFYADGSLVGEDPIEDYRVDWNTDPLADESWHALHCVAWDLAGNSGYSDTIHVQVRRGGERDLLHGSFTVAGSQRAWLKFLPDAGDTVAGDMRTADGRSLGLFLCVDAANYELYKQGGQYQALHREDNVSELSMEAAIPASDTFYLVFENSFADPINVWARFVLR